MVANFPGSPSPKYTMGVSGQRRQAQQSQNRGPYIGPPVQRQQGGGGQQNPFHGGVVDQFGGNTAQGSNRQFQQPGGGPYIDGGPYIGPPVQRRQGGDNGLEHRDPRITGGGGGPYIDGGGVSPYLSDPPIGGGFDINGRRIGDNNFFDPRVDAMQQGAGGLPDIQYGYGSGGPGGGGQQNPFGSTGGGFQGTAQTGFLWGGSPTQNSPMGGGQQQQGGGLAGTGGAIFAQGTPQDYVDFWSQYGPSGTGLNPGSGYTPPIDMGSQFDFNGDGIPDASAMGDIAAGSPASYWGIDDTPTYPGNPYGPSQQQMSHYYAQMLSGGGGSYTGGPQEFYAPQQQPPSQIAPQQSQQPTGSTNQPLSFNEWQRRMYEQDAERGYQVVYQGQHLAEGYQRYLDGLSQGQGSTASQTQPTTQTNPLIGQSFTMDPLRQWLMNYDPVPAPNNPVQQTAPAQQPLDTMGMLRDAGLWTSRGGMTEAWLQGNPQIASWIAQHDPNFQVGGIEGGLTRSISDLLPMIQYNAQSQYSQTPQNPTGAGSPVGTLPTPPTGYMYDPATGTMVPQSGYVNSSGQRWNGSGWETGGNYTPTPNGPNSGGGGGLFGGGGGGGLLDIILGGGGFGGGGGSSSGSSSFSSSGQPLISETQLRPEDIQRLISQRVDLANAQSGNNILDLQQQRGARGFAAAPMDAIGAMQRLEEHYGNQMISQALTEVPLQAQQFNAQNLLASQVARESQYQNRQNEEIERQRNLLGLINPLFGLLSGLI